MKGFIATDCAVPLTCIRETCWSPSSAQERGWLTSLQGAVRGLADLPAGCSKRAGWTPCSAQEDGCGLYQGHNYVSYLILVCLICIESPLTSVVLFACFVYVYKYFIICIKN